MPLLLHCSDRLGHHLIPHGPPGAHLSNLPTALRTMAATYINRAQRQDLIDDAVGVYQDDRDALAEFGSVDGIRRWLNSMGNVQLVTLLQENGWIA